MKKYWKLIMIVGVIVLCLGIFYVQTFHISKQYPDFKINAITGDNKVIDDIILNGEIHEDGYWYTVESFRLTNAGTSYMIDEPYFTRLNYVYPSYKIEKLQQDYRQFMRGKTEEPNLYYEDDKVLAYVNTTSKSTWDYYNKYFEIDIINKETRERNATVEVIPNRSGFDFLDIEAVRVIEDEVYIITKSHRYNEGDTETIISQYTFNLLDNKITDDKEIDKTVVPDGDYNSYLEIIPSASNLYEIVLSSFQIEYIPSTNDENDFREELTLQKLSYYDLKKQESKEITLPKQQGIPLALYENFFYFSETRGDGMTIYKFNMETIQIEDEVVIPIFKEYDDYITYGSISQLSEEGILYINPNYTGPSTPLYAVNLVTMEIAFEGEINFKNLTENENDMWINFTNVEIRQ